MQLGWVGEKMRKTDHALTGATASPSSEKKVLHLIHQLH